MSTTFLVLKNNLHWRVKTSNALNNTTDPVTFDLEDGTGAAGPTGNCMLTVWDDVAYPNDPFDDPNMEVFYLPAVGTGTGRHTDQLQGCVRAQEGSKGNVAHNHTGTPRVALLIMQRHFDDITGAINTLEAALASYLTTAAAAAAYQPLAAALTAIAAIGNVAGRILVNDGSGWTSLTVGTTGQVLTADTALSKKVKWADAVASTGTASIAVAQASHGLSVGHWVHCTGADTYAKATAASVATYREIVGRVSAVTDANNFTFTTVGPTLTGSGWTPGSVYWLSPTSAGGETATQPAVLGYIDKPMFVALNATTAVLLTGPRAMVVPVGSGAGLGGGGVTSPLSNVGELWGWDGADAAVPAPTTDGDVLTADSGADAGVSWQTPSGGGGGTFSGGRFEYNGTGQVMVDSTATPILFNTEVYDTDNYHDNSSNTERFTIPTTGKYHIDAHIMFGGSANGALRIAVLMHTRSATNKWLDFGAQGAPQAATNPVVRVSGDYLLQAGDIITLIGFQDNGGPMTIPNLTSGINLPPYNLASFPAAIGVGFNIRRLDA